MAGRMQDKVVFVTGAARGQGRAIALACAQQGADVIAVDLAGELPGVPYDSPTPADLEETVRLVEAEDRRIVARRGDVRELDTLKALVDDGVEELGRLDGIVANAGICIPNAWDWISPDEFRNVIDTNVVGVWNTVMAAAPHLVDGDGGSIVLTSSYAGMKVQPFMIHYSTSKHAVTGMARAFAAELGQHDIRVNSIHPGGVNTPMGSGDMQGALERAGETNPKLMGMGTPFLERYAAEADEIAAAVVWLLSDESRYVSAVPLSVDGGMAWF